MEKKINETFTKKFNNINKHFNPKNNYKIEFIDKNTIMFLSRNNKKILKASYNFYGILNESNNFIWSTSIPLIKDSFKKNVKDIKKKKDLFYDDYVKTMNDLSYFYFSLLDNDMVLLEDKMIENVNKLILYLTDDLFMFNPISSKGSTQFITINKILEIYT